jgi:hypothetical protein
MHLLDLRQAEHDGLPARLMSPEAGTFHLIPWKMQTPSSLQQYFYDVDHVLVVKYDRVYKTRDGRSVAVYTILFGELLVKLYVTERLTLGHEMDCLLRRLIMQK